MKFWDFGVNNNGDNDRFNIGKNRLKKSLVCGINTPQVVIVMNWIYNKVNISMKKDQKINIAICMPSFVIGGVETVFANTLDALLKNSDLNITVITHAPVREPLYRDWFDAHPDLPVYVYYPLCNWFEDMVPKCRGILKVLRKIVFSLYKKYRRIFMKLSNRLNRINVFIDYRNFEFFKELKYFNRPKIVWLHGALSYFESNGLFQRLPQYSKLVTITDDFVSDFKSKYPDWADKIVRIYNPLNADDIRKKSKLVKSPRGKYFCHVSRLASGKDINTLLAAFDIFAVTHDDVKLYIVGDGDKSTEFKSYAKILPSVKRIVFTGALNNPYGIMRGAIANILSSESEGLPTVLLESVALGVPCISSKCKNGPREILLNGRGGLLFETGDANALAKKMKFVFEHPAKAKQMSDIATNGLKRFDSTAIAKQINDLIHSLVVSGY